MNAFALSPEARLQLLEIVRQVLARGPGQPLSSTPAGPPELRAPGAAFVTLRRRSDHELRGCVGFLTPRYPLAETVARAAAAAAFEDSRFEPVASVEVAGLQVEISVLGPIREALPEAVEVGRHGLVVRSQGRSGLLLPQVPVEHGWDRTVFLDQTCRKAGLAAGAWRQADCEISIFEALVFGDE